MLDTNAATLTDVHSIDASSMKRPGFINVEIHHSELQGRLVHTPDHAGNYDISAAADGSHEFFFLAKAKMARVTPVAGTQAEFRIYCGPNWRYELKRTGTIVYPLTFVNDSFDNVLVEVWTKI